jgi:hypothetical protein
MSTPQACFNFYSATSTSLRSHVINMVRRMSDFIDWNNISAAHRERDNINSLLAQVQASRPDLLDGRTSTEYLRHLLRPVQQRT